MEITGIPPDALQSPRFWTIPKRVRIEDRVTTSRGLAFENGDETLAAWRLPTMPPESGWVAYSTRLGCEVVLMKSTTVTEVG